MPRFLKVTRYQAVQRLKVAQEMLDRLKELHPDREYEFDKDGIVGVSQKVFLDNLYREIESAPTRRFG